jgi:DNA replication protein DnaC
MLRGSTGTGKTRAMWRLLRRLFDEGRSIEALTAGEFGRSYADAAGQYRASAWFERLAAVDVLFVDDLGKGCWSEAVRAVFFDLIDKRTRFGRPVLITTNDTGPELSERMRDVNLGDPLVRRLREFCEVLKF